MTFDEVIQAGYPNADESISDHVLWGMTSFPFGKVSAKTLYKAASRCYRAMKNNIRLCEMCDNRAAPEKWCCSKCQRILEQMGTVH